MDTLHLPNDSHRLTVLGKTGSGKTVALVWHLSRRSYTSKPWYVLNFKRDDLIDSIPHAKELDLTKKLPKSPGIYIAHPMPDEDELLDRFFMRIWEQERTGLCVDEAAMVNKFSKPFKALYIQGRSKQIPVIAASQRPVDCNRSVFSEADFYQIFYLHDERDHKTVEYFVPMKLGTHYGSTAKDPLPEHYSIWHDVKRNFTPILRPVPDESTILETFAERLKPKRRFI